MPTRIVLADDHALVRQGIKSLLEREGLQVVGEASDGREAVHHAEALSPDIVVMDIGMPTLNGMEAARELARCCPKVKPILLTQHDEPQYVSAALKAGVKGYVLKSQVSSDLIHAIQQVMRGQVYLSPGISAAVMAAYHGKAEMPADPLTSQERQVLQPRDFPDLLDVAGLLLRAVIDPEGVAVCRGSAAGHRVKEPVG